MEINSTSLRALFAGFNASFQGGFAGVAPQWNRIATMVPSATETEDYAWLGEWPNLREWIGDRQVKSLSASNYSIKNKPFESSVAVKRSKLEDDVYGIYGPMFTEMGRAAAVHPDQLIFQLLLAGFTTACYDGQYFFDSDHPVGSGVVSNVQTGVSNPWFLLDTSRALKPLIYQKRKDYKFVAMTKDDDEAVFMRDEYRYGVDGRGNVGFGFWQMAFASKAALDATSFNAAYAAMMAFQSDQGRPLGIKPTLLLVGASNRAAALEVVKAERDAVGATNINKDVVEVMECPWLP
jgi:phage major head subunit gpT-like protein